MQFQNESFYYPDFLQVHICCKYKFNNIFVYKITEDM